MPFFCAYEERRSVRKEYTEFVLVNVRMHDKVLNYLQFCCSQQIMIYKCNNFCFIRYGY